MFTNKKFQEGHVGDNITNASAFIVKSTDQTDFLYLTNWYKIVSEHIDCQRKYDLLKTLANWPKMWHKNVGESTRDVGESTGDVGELTVGETTVIRI